MNIRTYFFWLLLLLISLYSTKNFVLVKSLGGSSEVNDEVSKRQNVVLIIIDDLGIRDLSCYGSKFYETPNIDKLAAEGVKFENAYAAHPKCLPSRVSLLSGVYPARLGQPAGNTEFVKYGHINAKKCFGKLKAKIFPNKLPSNQAFTLGKAFKEHGYHTAYLGKWHIGIPPTEHGFDRAELYSALGAVKSHFAPYFPTGNILKLKKDKVQAGTYMADLLTQKTVDTMTDFQSGQKKNKPFFVVMSHYAVHTPIEGPRKFHGMFQNKLSNMSPREKNRFKFDHNAVCKITQDNVEYAAMLKSVDDSVGKVRAFLQSNGLTESTTILFTSDNGGLSTRKKHNAEGTVTSNMPYRGGKYWLYEGGIRVPLIIYSPNKQKSRNATSFRSIGMDKYPTLLDLAGLPLYPSVHRDGISLVPALTSPLKVLDRKETFFWNYPTLDHGGEGICSAALKGVYKLVKFDGPISDGYSDSAELYNILNDPFEQNNIAVENPQKVTELLKDLMHWKRHWVNDTDYTKLKCEKFLEYDQWKDVTNSTKVKGKCVACT
eukprot:CAMPEP_0194284614 /NCGR_PEP_ID=MMETSP0169-20130528/28037_1 /TAXON_ID=218684 /ORGANISM="Corethron pennatum, Strain L29A3" /LENGTH=544 /DNA_ID=CAMNT_0039030477 /DNA_START=31 /DNA_END=1665 /DNA_ORIENTATION=+